MYFFSPLIFNRSIVEGVRAESEPTCWACEKKRPCDNCYRGIAKRRIKEEHQDSIAQAAATAHTISLFRSHPKVLRALRLMHGRSSQLLRSH